MAEQRRSYRVGERIHAMLARELQRASDPRFSLITISSVVMSPDLKIAKVYWFSITGDETRRFEAEEAFEGSGGRFRKAVAKSLKIRIAPELRFYYDDTLDTLDKVDELMSRLNEKESL